MPPERVGPEVTAGPLDGGAGGMVYFDMIILMVVRGLRRRRG
jgi:hypothetical protein